VITRAEDLKEGMERSIEWRIEWKGAGANLKNYKGTETGRGYIPIRKVCTQRKVRGIWKNIDAFRWSEGEGDDQMPSRQSDGDMDGDMDNSGCPLEEVGGCRNYATCAVKTVSYATTHWI